MISAIELAESGNLPDSVVAMGIRRLLRQRIDEEEGYDPLTQRERFDAFVRHMNESPIALETGKANEQHYEVPPEFFVQALGPNLKYSGGYWPREGMDLAASEEAMLELTMERAELRDGQDVLELGCGWGSLTLAMAKKFPNSKILAVSNSAPQREFILARARERGLANVEVVTADMNGFTTERRFDRAVSVEMFEHMRNWKALLHRVSTWLRPGGKLFIHIFVHARSPYPFEVEGDHNWMGRYFFTGGIMPSDDLIYRFQDDLVVEEHWQVDGTHYEKTSRAWLANMDARKAAIMPVLKATYGEEDARRWFGRWRIFFLACAELFGWQGGRTWWVSHYRLTKRG